MPGYMSCEVHQVRDEFPRLIGQRQNMPREVELVPKETLPDRQISFCCHRVVFLGDGSYPSCTTYATASKGEL